MWHIHSKLVQPDIYINVSVNVVQLSVPSTGRAHIQSWDFSATREQFQLIVFLDMD